MVQKRFHGGIVWQRARAQQLARVPYCERCIAEHALTAATVVHHHIDVDERPDLRLDPGNLESLCRACHEAGHGRALGYSKDFDVTGHYVDPRHPSNRPPRVIVKPTPARRTGR
jgi:hypothetical protein